MDLNKIKLSISELKDFSGSILIKQKGKVLFQESVGLADINYEIKNENSTKYGIASGAKLFTAIAICQLVERGVIKFESLLKECLKINYPNYDDRITIKHLLTHTSGIPDYFEQEDIDNVEEFCEIYQHPPMYLIRSPKDYLKLLKNEEMEFKPGEKFDYTNAGYILLGLVIEEQTGISFVAYVENNIINKLELKNTGYYYMDNLPKDCSCGYTKDSKGVLRKNIYSVPIVGGADGGVFINTVDMSKVWEGLLSYKLLNEDITKEVLKPHSHCGNDCYYGYGMYIIKREDGIYKYFLMGGDPGAEFMSAVYCKSQIEVIVMCNRDSGASDVSMIIEKVIDENTQE